MFVNLGEVTTTGRKLDRENQEEHNLEVSSLYMVGATADGGGREIQTSGLP